MYECKHALPYFHYDRRVTCTVINKSFLKGFFQRSALKYECGYDSTNSHYVKTLIHTSRIGRVSPQYECACLVNPPLSDNLNPQVTHLYGFSPV